MVYTAPPSSDLSYYLSLSEAVRLGYGGYQTLRDWIAAGRLPAVKIGSRVKVLRSDLDALAVPVGRPMRFATVESAIERIVEAAPPLTDEQIARLTGILASAGGGAK